MIARIQSLFRSLPALTAPCLVLLGAVLCAVSAPSPVLPTSIIALDDFESTSIRIVNTAVLDPQSRLLWNQLKNDFSEGPDPGVEEISTDTAYRGGRSLKITVTSGNVYLQLFTNDGARWHWMREYTEPAYTWTMDTYTRMRFWIKVPSSVKKAPVGQSNFQLGTYVRSSKGDPSSAESGGSHWYHHFNIPYTGEWHQIIVDTHPNHQRGGSGGTEWGNQPYPTAETRFNYFDALTRFYFDGIGKLAAHPAVFYFDRFELYREPNPESVDQVYSLHGAYNRSTNEIYVGWMRNKNENSVKHEVRYAFRDIFEMGWDAATRPPNGIIAPPGFQGYNGMEWSTRSLNLTGRSTVFIGIKPQFSKSFRQIAIPVFTASGTAPSRKLGAAR